MIKYEVHPFVVQEEQEKPTQLFKSDKSEKRTTNCNCRKKKENERKEGSGEGI